MIAFHLYAGDNQGQFPANFDPGEFTFFFPDEAKVEHNLRPNEFLPGTSKYGLTPDRFEIL